MTAIELLQAIVERRKALNISEAELARIVGIERRYCGRMLAGKHSPTLDVFLRLCEAVGIRIELNNPPVEGAKSKQ